MSRRRPMQKSVQAAETLEVRVVPAVANVEIVQTLGNVLKIKAGGDEAVRLDFIASDTGMRVVAGAGTTVNGAAEQFFANVKAIRGKLGDGSDVVTLTEYNSISGLAFNLNLGNGDNRFESTFIPLDSLTIVTGNGSDQILISNTGCGTLALRTGGGEDAIDFIHSSSDGPAQFVARDRGTLRLSGSRFGNPAPRYQNIVVQDVS